MRARTMRVFRACFYAELALILEEIGPFRIFVMLHFLRQSGGRLVLNALQFQKLRWFYSFFESLICAVAKSSKAGTTSKVP